MDQDDLAVEEGELDDDVQRLGLELVWADMSATEQSDLCFGLEIIGLDVAVDQVVEGAGSGFDSDQVEDFLLEKCE